MNGTRRVGLILAGAGGVLWLAFVAAVLATGPGDGANIGAGLLALLALPLSVGASITLLLSMRAGRTGLTAGPDIAPARTPLESVAAVLALISALTMTAFMLIPPADSSDTPRLVTLGAGIVALVASSTLFAVATRRRA